MARDQLQSRIEYYLPEFLKTLGKVVEAESPSHESKPKSDECADILQELFEDVGFRIERIPQEMCGDDIYGEIGDGDNIAIIIGHYDTVYPIGTIERMPWKVVGDKAYGPGVLDMKGGIIMAYYGIKALEDLGLMPKGKFGIYLNGNEESGSFYSLDKIIQKSKKYGAALIMEPGVKELGSVKIMRYGRGTYNVTIHGKGAHSGSNPHLALSPFIELANQIYKIQKWNETEKDATFAVTVVKGGIDGTCVIPETASFTMDVRYRTEDAMKRNHERILAMRAEDDRYTLSVQGRIDKPIMNGDKYLYKMLERIGLDYDVVLKPVISSGGSDGNFTAGSAKIATIDGIGMSGEFLHTADEYVNVNHIVQRTAMFSRLLQALAEDIKK